MEKAEEHATDTEQQHTQEASNRRGLFQAPTVAGVEPERRWTLKTLTIATLGAILPGKPAYPLITACTIAIVLAIIAVIVITLTTQRALGFVILGLGVLAAIIGLYPQRRKESSAIDQAPHDIEAEAHDSPPQEIDDQRNQVGKDRPVPARLCQQGSVKPVPYPSDTEPQDGHAGAAEPTKNEETFVLPPRISSLMSCPSKINLDGPRPLGPANLPRSLSAATQSSASVRAHSDRCVGRHRRYPSSQYPDHSIRGDESGAGTPTGCAQDYANLYTELIAAVKEAYRPDAYEGNPSQEGSGEEHT